MAIEAMEDLSLDRERYYLIIVVALLSLSYNFNSIS